MIISERDYLRGLGVMGYYDLLNQVKLQDCDPRDSACVANNVAKEAAVEDYWVKYMSTGVPDGTVISVPDLTAAQVKQFYDPGNIFNGGNVVAQLPVNSNYNPPPAVMHASDPVTPYSPKLSFTTSRGSYALIPGDSWTVKITGAQPNTPVYVVGGLNGQKATTQMGATDGIGAFTLTGVIDVGSVGNWAESWMVGNQTVGGFNFTVAKPSSSSQDQTGGGSNKTNDTNVHSGGFNPLNQWIPDPLLSDSVPVGIAELGVALVIAFMMFGRR